jgi:hypothetical protein
VLIDPQERRRNRYLIVLLAAGTALFWLVLMVFSPVNLALVSALLLFAAAALVIARRMHSKL